MLLTICLGYMHTATPEQQGQSYAGSLCSALLQLDATAIAERLGEISATLSP
jgi:hypothetical protein